MSSVTYKAKGLKAVKARIVVKGMEFHERFTEGGILIPGDDTKAQGIRPRWAEVIAVGPDQHDVKVGEWVLVEHGRWTRGLKVDLDGDEETIRMIDENDILLVSDEPQKDETWGNAVVGNDDTHKIHGSLHNTGVDDF